MSINLHRAAERGQADHGWLHSRFSFSFAQYHNPRRMGFGALRVINDDIIEPGKGFAMHPHKEMEIISIVTQGELEHRDSHGNHGIIPAGSVQYMSAASGVLHSEYNPSDKHRVHLFQIWIHPKTSGGTPQYDERSFSADEANSWRVLVSPDGRDNSIAIKQDAFIYSATLSAEATLEVAPVEQGHGRLLLVIEGGVKIAGEHLERRDEVQIIDKNSYTLTALCDTKLLLFDVPLML